MDIDPGVILEMPIDPSLGGLRLGLPAPRVLLKLVDDGVAFPGHPGRRTQAAQASAIHDKSGGAMHSHNRDMIECATNSRLHFRVSYVVEVLTTLGA